MFGPPRSRHRGVVYAVGGVGLTLACLVILSVVADKMAAAGYQPTGGIKLLGAVPALGMAGGLCLVYVGLARLVAGKLVDKVNFSSLDGAGLLYALGFAAMIALAVYVVVGVYHIDPINLRRI